MNETNSNIHSVSNSRRNQIIVLVAVALILNALLNHFGSNDSDFNETLKAGDRFPSFTATDRTGATISDKSFAGVPTVYFFFANWCPCSHESIPWVKQAQEEFASSGLSILGVGIQDQEERLELYVKFHQLTFPVITNEAGETLARATGVKVTPTSIFVDAQGVVRAIHVGKIAIWDQMKNGLETIINRPVESSPGKERLP